VWPSYNGQTSFEVSFSPNSLRTKVEAGLDDVRKVTVFVTSAYDVTGREKKVNGLAKFTLPYKVRWRRVSLRAPSTPYCRLFPPVIVQYNVCKS